MSKIDHNDMQEYTLTHLTATDAVGRTLPEISGFKADKSVGIFYFLWHGQHNPGSTVRNVTELLKTNYDDVFSTDRNNAVVPEGAWLFINEPLYGYYNSEDEWVMRKHIELFIAAGVDFVMFDFTNGYFYTKPLQKFINILLEYKEAGWNVPKISFYLWIKGNTLAKKLIKSIYSNEKYDDIVYRTSSGKPLLVGSIKLDPRGAGELLEQEVLDFFDVRQSQVEVPDHERLWPYWQYSREWKVYVDMVNVSSAQAEASSSFAYECPAGWPSGVHGRGWSSTHPENGDPEAIMRGDNVQEGWDNAIERDPEIIFVCGWNELVTQKFFHPGGFVTYTDNFTVEHSRDIEMLKSASYVMDEDGNYIEEGYGDNFYLQMVYNLRRFKGVAGQPDETLPDETPIDISGDLSQWDNVNETYLALSTNKEARNAKGFYDGLRYTEAAPDNIITEVKVAYDSQNVYFKVTAADNITTHPEGSENWMNLMIGVTGSSDPSWSTFNYVVNRYPGGNGKTSVEGFTESEKYELTSVGEASYSLSGNVLQFAVPRDVLGIGNGGFRITFKITDGITEPDNILDYYVSGESFPVGRYAYSYRSSGSEHIAPGTTEPDKINNGYGNDRSRSALPLALGLGIGGAVLAGGAITAGVLINKKRKSKK